MLSPDLAAGLIVLIVVGTVGVLLLQWIEGGLRND